MDSSTRSTGRKLRQIVSGLPPHSSSVSLTTATPPAPASSRRAASVTSARPATRRHRHARSHHGGSSSYLPQNEFPVFSQNGDIEIVISSPSGRKENRYLLHRLILSQYSGFFEAGTRAEWSGSKNGDRLADGLSQINENESVTAGGSSRASSQERRPSIDQTRQKWHYVLDWEAAGDSELPMLVQKDNGSGSIFGNDSYIDQPPPTRSKPPLSSERFFRSMGNFSSLNLNTHPSTTNNTTSSLASEPGDEVLKDYDNLFRIMYQHSPILDDINIATAYSECKGLLHLADMYDALEIVGNRVDHHLLRFGARLFKQIAKYPPSYLKLGYLARSRTIFTEALVHVVGQWPAAKPQLRGQVDASVIELLEDKIDELAELQERVETKLWRLNLTTSRGERVTPTNDFLSWLAVSYFRQWLAENTTPPLSGILKDTTSSSARISSEGGRSDAGGNHFASQRIPPPPTVAPQARPPGRAFRLIGSPDPTSYLTHDELKRALKAPAAQLGIELYTRENLRRLERRVDEIKNLAREAVRPLVRNALELDLRDFGPAGLGYLTCTRLEARELPWEQ